MKGLEVNKQGEVPWGRVLLMHTRLSRVEGVPFGMGRSAGSNALHTLVKDSFSGKWNKRSSRQTTLLRLCTNIPMVTMA